MFIDIHSHLEACKNISLSKIISNSQKAGVEKILTCGTDKKTNREVLNLSKDYEEVEACLGVYPSETLKLSESELDKEIGFIKSYKENIVAIGEVGLDLNEPSLGDEKKTLEKQKNALKKFVELSKEIDKPLVIHSRKAETETIEFLESLNAKKVLMHCFSGKKKLIRRIIDNGWYLSVPANIKNATHFQKLVELTPIEQLFCETDSPFLHPDKLPDNEPANVVESYKKIAEIKGISLKDVEEKIEGNYYKLFGNND